MRLHLLPCLFAALTFTSAAAADPTSPNLPPFVEIDDNLPPLPDYRPPIATPDFIQCAGFIAQICVIVQPTPCAGPKNPARLDIARDPQGIGIYLEVGVGGPGGYGAYSERC